jgi:hypothetical protein
MLLVHNNEIQANRLVSHLANDFDIYVHIDKRSKLQIKRKENVFIFKRYKVYWASLNIILATLYLMQKAYKKGYDRYILISGQDLPIKTNDEIRKFFVKNTNEYIYSEKLPRSCWNGNGGFDRVIKYWPNRIYTGNKYFFYGTILRWIYIIEKLLFKVLLKIKRRPFDYEYYGGSQWFNFTNHCMQGIFEYLRENKKYIKRFRWTHCSDEIFFQTIINKIRDGLTIVDDYLRYIDWGSGGAHPKVLREEDYEKITESNDLFARKFDMDIDSTIIELLYKKIHENPPPDAEKPC